MRQLTALTRRFFLSILGGASAAVASGCAPSSDAESASQASTEDGFDFIVVGSGAGGGPLACNLAREGFSVLLLEAGFDDGNLRSQQIPALHARSTEEAPMRWDYYVKHYDDDARGALDSKYVHDPSSYTNAHHEPGVLYPRAGTLGGCTAHNAMITVYPHERDFAHIADLTGDIHWQPDVMRRYFELLERCSYEDEGTPGHGFDGWLDTTLPEAKLAVFDDILSDILRATATAFTGIEVFSTVAELIKTLKRDLNTAEPGRDQIEGMFNVPMATDGQRRKGPRDLIIETIEQGHPLTVYTGALASRVLFDDTKRAEGVEFLARPGIENEGNVLSPAERAYLYRASPLAKDADVQTHKAFAKREVILAAGAFNTPQLLKLSGVGPTDELSAFGIETLVDLPGVGTNLQDRYEVGVIADLESKPFSGNIDLIEDCTFVGDDADPCTSPWLKGEGPYTSNGVVSAVILKSKPSVPETDLIVFGVPGAFKGYHPDYTEGLFADRHHFTWAVLKAHTGNNAGTVTLRSTDPRDVPSIRFRYFDEGTTAGGEDQHDLDAVVEGIKLARRIRLWSDLKLTGVDVNEELPGSDVEDAALREFVKNEAWGHHASCTCPIGRDDDPMAVLDARFRVRGTEGLRVVDASVFPKIPGFFIVTPIYMASEKATDDILEDHGRDRRVYA